MSVNAKMTAIADAIRAKTGGTEALTLDQMAVEIAAIQGNTEGGTSEQEMLDALASGTWPAGVIELTASTVGKYSFSGVGITGVRGENATQVSSNGFLGCTSLKTVDMPNVITLEESAFQGCSSLETVSFPNLAKLTGYNIFRHCTAIKRMVLPSLTTISGFYTWGGTSAMELLDIGPLLITFAGRQAFLGTSALKVLVLRYDGVCALSSSDSLTTTPISKGSGYILVPAARVEEYKAATNWSSLTSQFLALEDFTIDGTTTGQLDDTKIEELLAA